MNSTTLLSSDALVLVPLKVDDVTQEYVDWLNDIEVNKFLESRHNIQDMHSVKNFVELSMNNKFDFLFGIFIRNQMRHIGNIRLHSIDTINLNGEIGLFIGDKNSWGNGYATKSIFLTSQFAFNQLKLKKLTAGCNENNIGSRKAFEKCGFTSEGFLRSHIKSLNGRDGVWRLGCLEAELTNVA